MTLVVGLDLSLTSSGVAIIGWPGPAMATPYAHVSRVRSKGTRGDTLQDRHARLRMLAQAIIDEARGAALVVVEQPAFSAVGGSHHDRSGLWWLVVGRLLSREIPVVEVTPGQLKKYATGSGVAGKDAVLAAVVRRYPCVDVGNNDEADALVLAAIGARRLGFPLEESLPKPNLTALEAVSWPGG